MDWDMPDLSVTYNAKRGYCFSVTGQDAESLPMEAVQAVKKKKKIVFTTEQLQFLNNRISSSLTTILTITAELVEVRRGYITRYVPRLRQLTRRDAGAGPGTSAGVSRAAHRQVRVSCARARDNICVLTTQTVKESIRNDMHAIYHLVEGISTLDMVMSFATLASVSKGYSRPIFDDVRHAGVQYAGVLVARASGAPASLSYIHVTGWWSAFVLNMAFLLNMKRNRSAIVPPEIARTAIAPVLAVVRFTTLWTRLPLRQCACLAAVLNVNSNPVAAKSLLASAACLLMLLFLLFFTFVLFRLRQPSRQSGEAIVLSRTRHPLAEQLVPDFQPNDTFLGPMCRFHIITGANTAGKSTYLRQTCLVVIMAHLGSYVPAEFCTTRPVRKLFSRIGTEDDLEANASTFAVEMKEAAFILDNVTPDSLVVIDELGRGTSNTDGAALAWAISEQLVEKQPYVLFATHFHELTEMPKVYEDVHNSHLSLGGGDDGPLGSVVTGEDRKHVLAQGCAVLRGGAAAAAAVVVAVAVVVVVVV